MSTQAPARIASATNVRARRGLVVFGGTVGAIAVWALADPLAGADLAVTSGDTTQQIGLGAVAGASLLAGLAAWALLALLERTTSRARRTWTIVAVVVLVLSLAGPLGSGVDAVSKLVLAGLHLVVGVTLVAGLRRAAR